MLSCSSNITFIFFPHKMLCYKWCGVPSCTNTSIKTPNKLFLRVPDNSNTRKKWFQLARRVDLPAGMVYFCEDHFDLPQDMQNYREYMIMGTVRRIVKRPGCLPSKFECQPGRTKEVTERGLPAKKRRKVLVSEALASHLDLPMAINAPDAPCPAPVPEPDPVPEPNKSDKGVQASFYHPYRSKHTQTRTLNMTSSSTSPFKKWICAFRLSELQNLLAFAGRSRVGRKSELQARALELLALKSPNISHKIRKLYEHFLADLNNSGAIRTESSITPVDPSVVSTVTVKNSLITTITMQPHNNRPYSNYPPAAHPPNVSVTRNQAPMYNSNNPYGASHHQPHINNSSGYTAPSKPLSMPSQYPVHPDVKFKRLPFYDHIGELIKPSSLVPHGNQRQQEGTFMFHLTPAQADMIGLSRDVRPGTRVEFTTHVQLRFCLLETTSEQEDCFPPGVMVKVNQKLCQLPNPIPPNKPGVEPKRPPRPVNITHLIKISPVVPNAIQIVWSTDYTRGYVLAVHLVNKKSSEDLLNRLKSKGVRAADYTRGMIKDKLKEDGEIATTSLRVSLACPLGKCRMSTPCRASTCGHFQCFDASLFIQMNEKKPQWMCPVCNNSAFYDKLVIDGYFLEVLQSTMLPADCNEIELTKNGSWAPLLVSKKDGSMVVEKVETPVKPEPVKKEAAPPAVKKDDSENVPIFTLSDSDDDAPLMPKKRTATESSALANIPDTQTASRASPSLITIDDESPSGSPAPPVTNYNNGRAYAGYGQPHIDPYPY